MAFDTYSNLKTALTDWLHREDLTPYYDDWIDLTEALLKRPPRDPREPDIGGVRANLTTTTGTLSGDSITLPSDFLEPVRLRLTASGQVLQFVSREALAMAKKTGNGFPKFYSVTDAIELDVTPDSEYAYELVYYPTADALSGSNTTNWLLTGYPDVYFAGCMYHAHRFTQDSEQANEWLSTYKNAAWTATQEFQNSRRTAGALKMIVEGPTP